MVGDFNKWKEDGFEMTRLEPLGIWELFVPGVETGVLYKYLIETEDGRLLYKADPFAYAAEMRPGTASKVADITGFKWSDQDWIQKRRNSVPEEAPLYLRGSSRLLEEASSRTGRGRIL